MLNWTLKNLDCSHRQDFETTPKIWLERILIWQMKKPISAKVHPYLKYASFITDEEMMTMTDLSPRQSGIKDIVIWVGQNPHSNHRRIKVSNVPNSLLRTDCFSITLPKLTILGKPNRKLITEDVMNDIFNFIALNMQSINEYSDEKTATDAFFDKIVAVR